MDTEEALQYAARELRHGSNRPRVRQELIEEGLEPEQATQIYRQAREIVEGERRAEAATEGRWKMLAGGVLVAIGVAVTVYSVLTAQTTGFYIAPTGLIAVGAYLFFAGKMRV